MNREIKFRAWDTVSKKFLDPWPEGFHVIGETTCFDLIGQQLKDMRPQQTTLELINGVEIMQYTGLKDKNGKEIWEGDWVKAERGEIGDIDFLNGRFCWSQGGAHWNIVYDDEHHNVKDEQFTECLDLEVIGNVYETPSLSQPGQVNCNA